MATVPVAFSLPQRKVEHSSCLPKQDHLHSKSIVRRLKDAEICARIKGFLIDLNGDFLKEKFGKDFVPKEAEFLNSSCSGIERLEKFSVLNLTNLVVCNLGDNYLTTITSLDVCPNLIKLDLSNNQLTSLPPRLFWSHFRKLVVLFLHNNGIRNLEDVSQLDGCSGLQVLTVGGTPVSLTKGYRHAVVNSIYSLKVLDSHVISDEEIVKNLPLSGRFATCSKELRMKRPHPFPAKSCLGESMLAIRSLLCEVNRTVARCSPIAIIQRYIRGHLTRKRLKAKGINVTCFSCDMLSPRSRMVINLPDLRDRAVVPRSPSYQQAIPIYTIGDDKAALSSTFSAGGAGSSRRTMTDEKLKKGLQDCLEQIEVPSPVAGKVHVKAKSLGHQLGSVADGNSSDSDSDSFSSGSDEEHVHHENVLLGKKIRVRYHRPADSLKMSRKRDRYFVRRAAVKIEATKAAERVIVRLPQRCDVLLKDDLDFRRMHDNMKFSILESVSKAYQCVKNQDDNSTKRTLVMNRMNDRLEGKRKVDEFHLRKKESIMRWKEAHSTILKNTQDHHTFETDLKHEVHCGTVNMKHLENDHRRDDLKFLKRFSTVNSSVSESLKKEDNTNRTEEQLMMKRVSVREERQNALVSRTMMIEQQEEKAELARLYCSRLRLQLMRDKYKNILHRQALAKEKIAKVKQLLPPCSARNSNKFPTQPFLYHVDGSDNEITDSSTNGGLGGVFLPPSDNFPTVLNLSLEDAPHPTAHSGLPARPVLRHSSFIRTEKDCDLDLPLTIASLSLADRH